MARRVQIKATIAEGQHWMSATDLMASLMLIFMFIAIVFMITTSKERDEMRNVAEEWAETKEKIYDALVKEFHRDLPRWNAEIEKETLTIRFKEPTVLFSTGETKLTRRFQIILKDFFPRYARVLYVFDDHIAEIRIEGHTSSEWERAESDEDAYRENMRLSQGRTEEVLVFSLAELVKQLHHEHYLWTRGELVASGFSSSKLIVDDRGNEDRDASRRVEFRVRTNADEKLTLLLGHALARGAPERRESP